MRIVDVSFGDPGGSASRPAWLLAGPQAAVPTTGNPPAARIEALRLAAPLAGEVRLALRGGCEVVIAGDAGRTRDGAPVVDHVTLCVDAANLDRYTALLVAQLPGAACQRHRIGAPEDGMDIVAVWEPASGVHVVLAAPSGPGGHVAGFLEAAGAEGVQHVAFTVPDLAAGIAALEARGLSFVGGPGPSAMIELRDGERWLRQVFSEPVWGGFFVELVERHGVAGLHAPNIGTMYAAKETDYLAALPPTVSAARATLAAG